MTKRMTRKEKACQAFTIADRFSQEQILALVNGGAAKAATERSKKAVSQS
jgi:hypothetical protein